METKMTVTGPRIARLFAILLATLACTVEKTAAPTTVASVSVREQNISVQVGHTRQLTAVVTGTNGKVLADRTVTWRSIDSSAARVSSTGLVTGLKPATVVVSATSEGTTGETTLTVTTPPRTHPSWVRDSTWNESNTGMTLVYESQMGGLSSSWGFREVTDSLEAVRKGWKAQRFETRPGDCYSTDCDRSPVFERNEFAQVAGENLEGDEYWYAWSFYVPANTPQAAWVFYGQFQQHSNYDSVWMFLKRAGQPFCAVFDWKRYNQWNCTGRNYPLISDGEFAGSWHDVLVHAKWTTDSLSGFTRIFIDGELVVDFQGYTRTVGNQDVYFKYGIYRHASNVTTVIYYDEIRRGRTRGDVDLLFLR